MFARSFVMCLLLPGCIVVGKDFEDTGDDAEFQARVDAAVQAALAQQVVVTLIEEDTVWNVAPGDDLPALLRRLDRYLVASDATLTLQFEAGGTYTLAGPIHLHHPSGGRIRIQGDDDNPAILVLNGTDGLIVDESSALGFFGGVELQQVGEPGSTTGIRVTDASSLKIGAPRISGFYYGLKAEHGSAVDCERGLLVENTSYGVLATEGSFISANGLTVTAGVLNPEIGASASLGSALEVQEAAVEGYSGGIRAEGGSAVSAIYSSVSGGTEPFSAYGGSYLAATEAAATSGSQAGFTAVDGSVVEADGARSADNGTFGYYAFRGAYLTAYTAEADANAEVGFVTSINSVIWATDATGQLTFRGGLDSDTTDFIIGLD